MAKYKVGVTLGSEEWHVLPVEYGEQRKDAEGKVYTYAPHPVCKVPSGCKRTPEEALRLAEKIRDLLEAAEQEGPKESHGAIERVIHGSFEGRYFLHLAFRPTAAFERLAAGWEQLTMERESRAHVIFRDLAAALGTMTFGEGEYSEGSGDKKGVVE